LIWLSYVTLSREEIVVATVCSYMVVVGDRECNSAV